MDKYESEHNKTIERYAMLIKQLFGIALNEFAQVASIVEGDYSGNEMFNFDDYPQTKATVNKIVNTLAKNMNVSVVNGCQAVWDISNKKNNALVESLFKGKDLTDEQKIRYFQNNEPALKAFTERKHSGLRLSDRVWNIVGGYKNDIETALSVSIEQGKSAHDLAKEVQQYLNEPDKLFRRVRDEFGELQLSKNAKSYHPGAGVYRSSYKNALRLARTEINMAYRTADFTRYQQLDFIVGIEIKTSGNHPEHDICDQLAGRYPKDFKFVGWHPNCRCYQKTILKTEEEMERDEERMRKGQEPTANSENSVNDVPDEFKEWVEDNEEKIKRAKNKPYFVTDNKQYIQSVQQGNPLSILYDKSIQFKNKHRNWAENDYVFSPEQIHNNKELESILGIKQGKQMPFLKALQGANEQNDDINCQSCVVAYEMRLRGFNVSANKRIVSNESQEALSRNETLIWKTTKGNNPIKQICKQKGLFSLVDIQNYTKEAGRYTLSFSWFPLDGHIMICERLKDGTLRFIEPQSNKIFTYEQWVNIYSKKIDFSSETAVMRIDNLLVNTNSEQVNITHLLSRYDH